jgi:AcrR family transcriptional regulator
MSPRPYRLGQRQVLADETRSKILDAARAQLETEASFSIDAVARRADVARMTVYYQFGSKRGLLEALFDALAASGGLRACRRPSSRLIRARRWTG